MGQISQELPLNLQILRQCREQMGLSVDDVARKVPSIDQMEEGKKRPTYNQLDKLAELYEVPDWVFISEILPQEYSYEQKPSFRMLRHAQAFQDSKVRRLITRVEHYRDFFIELRTDRANPITPFAGPDVSGLPPEAAANRARLWLGLEKPLDFTGLKEKLEEKSVFIFLTGKYPGWAHMDRKDFRALCLTHETMPVVIVNASDARKAQSFTLMHVLGHLLRGNISIDSWQESDDPEEAWCDQFAGDVLMPEEKVSEVSDVSELEAIREQARRFQVSPSAFLVRMRQLGRIAQEQYGAFEEALRGEYERQRQELQKNKGDPVRDRPREVRTQFGDPFVRTVLTAWHHRELNLLQVTKLLGLGRPAQVFELNDE